MKRSKKHLLGFTMVLLCVVAYALTGCFGDVDRILTAESYTNEYGEDFAVPYVTSTTGVEASVAIFDLEGYEVPIEYGTCTLKKGEYKIVFSAGELIKEVPLYCVDSTPPKISVSYTASAAVGHWYVLPKTNISDISGVEKSLTKVELYKAGEDTPLAAASGERVLIEDAEYYTLKISATDKDGNAGFIEKRIQVVSRPATDILQDFSEEVSPIWEKTYGAGTPIFQWLEEFEGRQGVIAIGVDGSKYENGEGYAWWTNLGMDDIDLVGATGFTIKLRAENCRLVNIKPSMADNTVAFYGSHLTGMPYNEGEWDEVYVSLVNADGVFSDITKATVGITVAPVAFHKDVCVWIDEIIVHYTPYEEYTLTVEDGSYDYPYDTIPAGRKVTIIHDNSKTPSGKAFSHYVCNGHRVWGDVVTVNEDAVLIPVYVDLVTEEAAIPDGAVLVTDFSNKGYIVPSRPQCVTAWYATYKGVSGVLAIGLDAYNEYLFPNWIGILPAAFNFEPYTYITFRMMVNRDALSSFAIVEDDNVVVDLLAQIPEGEMDWVDIQIPVEQLDGLLIGLKNIDGQFGEMVWIDQIYVQ